MVLSTSQQVALAFTAVLLMFVVLPKMFSFGGGSGAKETRLDPRYSRKGGPALGPLRGPAASVSAPSSHQSAESVQQMKKLMEQELKGNKYKSNNNKGYVFTLMPLYAIGVGVFAAYKFLKIKSSDDQVQKDKFAKGAKKSVEAENQLNELEQRLAQTEQMLNSILTQLDPLTNCAKTVAQEQKNEIMSQLQTIRCLMKKRGMDCPPLNEACFEQSLDNLIETLGASDTSAGDASNEDTQTPSAMEDAAAKGCPMAQEGSGSEGGDIRKPQQEGSEGDGVEEKGDEGEEMEETDQEDGEEEEGYKEFDFMPSLEDTNNEETGKVQQACSLRQRSKMK
ncbi:coiled-coil domain-containing protein 107 [Dunckerocampus dactyliophorus]|uniref:coiled-coil domain-containing protein 107 n=1 Tax=Dunckerocampus dactyliophorus TaxID=161453 RepID=UPI002405590B|nr:coiled-coil domain-containing protein 107 [Dunckerocampus dactyliophorus]